jgi:hypothetical protein
VRKAGDGGAELTSVVNDARWLRWSGEVDHAPKSCSEVGGCSGTYRGRKGTLVRSGDGGTIMETRAEAAASLPVDHEASGVDKMHGEGPYSCVGRGWMGRLSHGS